MLLEIGGEVTPGRLKRRRYQGNPEWHEWAYDMWNIAGKKYYLLLLGVCISACYKMIWSRKEQKETKEYLNLFSASTHSISGVATSTLGCVPTLPTVQWTLIHTLCPSVFGLWQSLKSWEWQFILTISETRTSCPVFCLA